MWRKGSKFGRLRVVCVLGEHKIANTKLIATLEEIGNWMGNATYTLTGQRPTHTKAINNID